MNPYVVITAPISTTNITGLRAMVRGSSLTKLWPIAGSSSSGSVTLLRRRLGLVRGCDVPYQSRRNELEVLENRSERDGGEERERGDDQDRADQQRDEQRSVGGERSGARGHDLLLHEVAGHRHHRDEEEVATHPHGAGEHEVVEVGVAGEARERAAVVAGRRRERVENLGELCGVPWLANRACLSSGCQHSDRGESEDGRGQDQDGDRRELDVTPFDLLAQVLGRSSDHQPGDEDGDDGEDDHAVETGADVARRDLAEFDEHQRHQPADRRHAVL